MEIVPNWLAKVSELPPPLLLADAADVMVQRVENRDLSVALDDQAAGLHGGWSGRGLGLLGRDYGTEGGGNNLFHGPECWTLCFSPRREQSIAHFGSLRQADEARVPGLIANKKPRAGFQMPASEHWQIGIEIRLDAGVDRIGGLNARQAS